FCRTRANDSDWYNRYLFNQAPPTHPQGGSQGAFGRNSDSRAAPGYADADPATETTTGRSRPAVAAGPAGGSGSPGGSRAGAAAGSPAVAGVDREHAGGEQPAGCRFRSEDQYHIDRVDHPGRTGQGEEGDRD